MSRRFAQNVIALVYDFDGTLSPRPMQEYTVLPKLGIDPAAFWSEVDEQARAQREEPMLAYMRLIMEHAQRRGVAINRREFAAQARNVQYFPGVETWFTRINAFVKRQRAPVALRHYVISAGLKEILDGISIRRHLHNVFASEYHYDRAGAATFPKLLVTDTTKTQFLFRINKGREDIRESINTHMESDARAIPFENIVYVGDGDTDVPGMTVTRKNGGSAIAVFRPGRDARARRSVATCRELLRIGRVNFIARADYSAGGELERHVHVLLRSVIAQIAYRKDLHDCRRQYHL